MDLDYSVRGQCKVTMIGYVDKILAAWKKADHSVDDDGFKTVGPK